MNAAEATRLATEVRNSYLTRRREVEDVAKALDILHKILVWAETTNENTSLHAKIERDLKTRVRLMAGQS